MEIHIASPDEGLLALMFLNPSNTEWVKSGTIKANGTADEMKNAIKGYYNGKFGVDPLVTLTYCDSSGAPVEESDTENIYKRIYTVKVPTAIESASVEQIMVVAVST